MPANSKWHLADGSQRRNDTGCRLGLSSDLQGPGTLPMIRIRYGPLTVSPSLGAAHVYIVQFSSVHELCCMSDTDSNFRNYFISTVYEPTILPAAKWGIRKAVCSAQVFSLTQQSGQGIHTLVAWFGTKRLANFCRINTPVTLHCDTWKCTRT